MPLDGDAVARACRDGKVVGGRQLCRAELERFRKLAADGAPLTVACTQEAPLFAETAGEISGAGAIIFVNIRETGGWSKDAGAAGPKMAALIAASLEPLPEVAFAPLTSEGVTLIYGKDERAIEAARLLKDHLDLTVLIKPPGNVAPPRATDFPVVKGSIVQAKGHLGAFELTVDDYAAPDPSSRSELNFGPARDGATSRCDIILDLSGGTPLFPSADLRDGYLRADPGDPAAVLRAVLKARDLVGTFDKPRYVSFTEDLCAHSRSNIVGCRRCLDLCPTGAIAPNGDHVAIDVAVCAGCGQCAAACPTGAAAYALPPSDALLRKLRTLLVAYREAGGTQAVVMFHDADHGGELIDALARHGDGLPANVLPVEINEVTQVGLEAVAASFAYGASAVRFLVRARPRHDIAGLGTTIALAQPILAGLGFAGARAATIETDDPDALGLALRAIAPMDSATKPATFAAAGLKRDIVRLALRELHAAALNPVDIVPLPQGAPFGTVEVKVEGCTLCLSCVSACPTGALSDDPERPTLRFAEDACVQCGLCQATCPEKVIALRPQIDFRAATAQSRVIKQEEPFACIRCGQPFGVKSSVERVAAKLEGRHWMYKDSQARLDVIKMCADCRVAAMTEDNFDPFDAPQRSKVRTTDDYLREREQKDGG
ncbi:MAG TPA: 4Fe-4S dicluster domain-containing protein [Pseudolabrys sp.]|nr:4Fe-4S dicluster domain-containing protein [Pseudolabrys sp.]